MAGLLAGLAQAQDGTRQWAVKVQGFITLSSPALSADESTVYVGVETQTGGRLIAFTREGALKWNFDRSEPIDSSPVVGVDGTVYIGCVDGRLYALDPQNRAIKWEYATGTFITSTPAIGADGTLYFGAGDDQLHAVAPNGTVRWRFPTGDGVDSSPAIGVDGTVYVGSNDKNLYAVNPDGTEKWRFATGGRIFSSPAIGADGTLYVGSGDQRLYAISRDGVKKWDYLTDGDIQASPSVGADGTIYFPSDVTLHALKPDGTGPRWRTRLNTTSASSVAIRGDGTLILGADDGVVRAINPDNGSVRWTFDTRTGLGNLIESSPIVGADGSIYIGSFDGNLYKLNGNGSPLSSYASWPAFHGNPQRRGRAQSLTGTGKLLNLSTRAQVGGTDTLISGFVVQGASPRAFLIRGIGPSLDQFGIAGMPDPRLTVFAGSVVVGVNDDWEQNEGGLSVIDTGNAVGAFPLPPGSKDAAIVLALPAGLYTTHISSTDGRGGVVLAELYDAVGGDPSGRLVNVSTRNQVGVEADSLFAGVALGGTGRSRLLMRAVGPGLAQFGLTNVLARPTMSVFAQGPGGQQQLIRTNTGWTTEGYTYDLAVAAQMVAAFPLAANSADCAVVMTVEPGNYTLQISGVGGTTGEALVEIYILP